LKPSSRTLDLAAVLGLTNMLDLHYLNFANMSTRINVALAFLPSLCTLDLTIH
jgi:hypothetical protein